MFNPFDIHVLKRRFVPIRAFSKTDIMPAIPESPNSKTGEGAKIGDYETCSRTNNSGRTFKALRIDLVMIRTIPVESIAFAIPSQILT